MSELPLLLEAVDSIKRYVRTIESLIKEHTEFNEVYPPPLNEEKIDRLEEQIIYAANCMRFWSIVINADLKQMKETMAKDIARIKETGPPLVEETTKIRPDLDHARGGYEDSK